MKPKEKCKENGKESCVLMGAKDTRILMAIAKRGGHREETVGI